MNISIPCRYILLMLLLCIAISIPAAAQNKVTLFLDDRRVADDDDVYLVDLWAQVATGMTWDVGGCVFVLTYNKAALELIADNPAHNPDPTLSSSPYLPIYTSEYNTNMAMTIFIFSSSYAQKTGIFRIGTYRFRILSGDLQDNLAFDVSGTATGTVILNGAQELTYNGGISGFGVFNPQPQVIFQCQNTFYHAVDCQTTIRRYTSTPVADNCLRWPREFPPGGSPYHRVKYQYDFNYNQSPAAFQNRTSAFDFNRLDDEADRARCRWEMQCEDEIEWEVTTIGGRLWWATRATDMFDQTVAEVASAITAHAVNPNNLTQIVDTAACGQYATRPNGHLRSEIIFNNTPEFYDTNPQYRWTTDHKTCVANGGTPGTCIDFRAIAQHELGHYLGLNHERHPHDVMTDKSYESTGPLLTLRQCDADRLRMLYESTRVGTPPDNTTSCELVGVEEQHSKSDILDLDLAVYPVPVYNGEFHVRYNTPQTGQVQVALLDILGNVIRIFVDRSQAAGEHTSLCNADGITGGVYYIRITVGARYRVQKILIQR